MYTEPPCYFIISLYLYPSYIRYIFPNCFELNNFFVIKINIS